MQVLSQNKLLIGITIIMILMGFAVMGQETGETATPTSLSNVTNQAIYSATPTSQSEIENEAILSPSPTSLSHTVNRPIVTTTPTSRSAVQNEPITTITASQPTDTTAPEQATVTKVLIQEGVDNNTTPLAPYLNLETIREKYLKEIIFYQSKAL